MFYRLAVVASTSDSADPKARQYGEIVAAYPPEMDFRPGGECCFFGALVDLPDSHDLAVSMAATGEKAFKGSTRKCTFEIDWPASGVSAEDQTTIQDISVASPDHRVWNGSVVDQAQSTLIPHAAVVRVDAEES